jgi:hypothetical protein
MESAIVGEGTYLTLIVKLGDVVFFLWSTASIVST